MRTIIRLSSWISPVLAALLVTATACKGSPEAEAVQDVDTASPDVGPEALDLDSAGPDTAVPWVNDVRCPKDPPWVLNTTPWSCQDDGLECRYPAAGCEPGVKPDNVCRCGTNGWHCTPSQFQNCLPTAPVPFGNATERPAAPRREAEVCASLEPKDVGCVGEEVAQPPYGCSTGADCDGENTRCLPGWAIGATSCTCMTNECVQDSDCGEGRACRCGTVGGACGGPLQMRPCLHRCVPSDCATEADCPAGQVCSPSRDECGRHIDGYHCRGHQDDCLSSWECAPEEQCRFNDATGRWGCVDLAMCD